MTCLLKITLIGIFSALTCAAQGQDIFIGTVESTKQGLALRRCDASQNRYSLVDAATASDKPVAALAKRLPRLKSPVYAEVIGVYEEQASGGHRLSVLAIDAVRGSKSCHLQDALDSIQPVPKR